MAQTTDGGVGHHMNEAQRIQLAAILEKRPKLRSRLIRRLIELPDDYSLSDKDISDLQCVFNLVCRAKSKLPTPERVKELISAASRTIDGVHWPAFYDRSRRYNKEGRDYGRTKDD
jgi:hypothetical protein